MKIMKRIATMLLAICLIVPCFSMVTQAAEGVIFFSDLDTKVGDEFDITGTVVSKSGTLKDISVQMSYDTSFLRFVSGDGVNADSEGKLTYTGTGSGDRIEFKMTFQALQEGSTRINQDAETVTTTDGETLDCTQGFSDVTIAAGDPSKIAEPGKTAEVTIEGQQYTISEAFSENEIPTGFTAGDVTYEDQTFKGAVQESSGLSMLYLVDSAQAGEFWVYDTKEGTFSPCEEIPISDEYSIIILNGTKEVKMPEKYQEAKIEINGNTFPSWQEPNRDGFYILYAVNNEGDKSLYLYDSLEHTYQRMETPKTAAAKKGATGFIGKLTEVITDYLIWFVVGAGCILVILLIFVLVLGIKLRHRNIELDDLYDEYGIDEEPQERGNQAAPGKVNNKFKKSYEDDDFDDFYEDEEYYEDDDFEDDDDLADLRRDFSSRDNAPRNFDDYYDDDDFEDDEYIEDKVDSAPKKNKKKDDTFTMDFIDLD